MEFFETTEKRGSYRGEFLEAKVPREDLEKIMGAVIKAPSGYNQQTTSFLVIEDQDLRAKIAELFPYPAVQTAPVIILAMSEIKEKNGLRFEVIDYGAAVQTLCLAVTAMGYATVWMDGDVTVEGNREKLKEMLGVAEHKTVRTILPVGVPKDPVKQAPKKALDERVTFL